MSLAIFGLPNTNELKYEQKYETLDSSLLTNFFSLNLPITLYYSNLKQKQLQVTKTAAGRILSSVPVIIYHLHKHQNLKHPTLTFQTNS